MPAIVRLVYSIAYRTDENAMKFPQGGEYRDVPE